MPVRRGEFWYPQRPEKMLGILRLELKMFVSHHVVLDSNPGPLEEHPLLSITEPSLQPSKLLLTIDGNKCRDLQPDSERLWSTQI